VAFVEVIETVGKVIDATGVAVIVGGALVAASWALTKRGVRSFELRKWELREGMIPIRLYLSRRTFDLN